MIGLTKWNPVDQWDPFKELEVMENRLGMLFGRLLGDRGRQHEAMRLTHWAPLVDITEDTKEYVIKAELPELKKEEVKVSVENGVLSICGERRLEKRKRTGSIIASNAPTVASAAVLLFLRERTRPKLPPNSETACSRSAFPRTTGRLRKRCR